MIFTDSEFGKEAIKSVLLPWTPHSASSCSGERQYAALSSTRLREKSQAAPPKGGGVGPPARFLHPTRRHDAFITSQKPCQERSRGYWRCRDRFRLFEGRRGAGGEGGEIELKVYSILQFHYTRWRGGWCRREDIIAGDVELARECGNGGDDTVLRLSEPAITKNLSLLDQVPQHNRVVRRKRIHVGPWRATQQLYAPLPIAY